METMTKKAKSIIGIVAAILVAVTAMMIIMPKNNFSSKLNTVVEVKNSVAKPEYSQTVVNVSKDGTYTISADWWMENTPGFVTGLIVTDEAGNNVFSVTGGMLTADSRPMDLKKGQYLFKFEPLASGDAYRAYCAEHFSGEDMGDIDEDLFTDGTWNMQYKVSINEYFKNAYLAGLICGVVIGILLVALVVVVMRKENAPAKKYDERQIAAQGEAFKYGFYTLGIYMLVLMVCHGTGVELPIDVPLQLLTGLLVSASVLATIMILKDAYFRLDENRTAWILFLAGFAILNFVIGVINIVNHNVLKDGVLSFMGCTNLLCGVVMLYLLAVILVKTVKDREED